MAYHQGSPPAHCPHHDEAGRNPPHAALGNRLAVLDLAHPGRANENATAARCAAFRTGSRNIAGHLAAFGKSRTGTAVDPFPSPPLSENAMNSALRRMGYSQEEMCAHGFRSSASTILNEHGFDPDVIEAALAHQDDDEVRRTYNRAKYWPERVKAVAGLGRPSRPIQTTLRRENCRLIYRPAHTGGPIFLPVVALYVAMFTLQLPHFYLCSSPPASWPCAHQRAGPCGAGVALQRSTSMQQVRKLVSKKELKTVHGIPYSFAHIARLEKAGRFPNGYSWAPAGSHGSRTRWKTGRLHAPEQHKRSLPPRSKGPGSTQAPTRFTAVGYAAALRLSALLSVLINPFGNRRPPSIARLMKPSSARSDSRSHVSPLRASHGTARLARNRKLRRHHAPDRRTGAGILSPLGLPGPAVRPASRHDRAHGRSRT